MKAIKRKPSKKAPSKRRSTVGAKRSRPAAAATTATKRSAVTSSATPTAPSTTSESRASDESRAGKAEAKQALFIAAYIANGQNGTQAAISAGYAPKSAHVTASRLLSNAKVAGALAEKQKKVMARLELTANRVLLEVARIALFDPRRLYRSDGTLKAVHELDDDTAAALAALEVDEEATEVGPAEKGKAAPVQVRTVTKRMRFCDKNAALGKAMQYLGLTKADPPIVPPQPPGPMIHAQNVQVNVLSPMETYQRMLTVSADSASR